LTSSDRGQKRLDFYILSMPAIESLLTNRYLHESPEFYKQASNYWEMLVLINNRLANWKLHPKDVQNFVILIEDEAINLLERLRKIIQFAQYRVRNQV